MGRRDNYAGMSHRFDVTNVLLEAVRRRGYGYPGMPAAGQEPGTLGKGFYGGMPPAPQRPETTAGGPPLRRQDALGRWYFMPIFVSSALGTDIEIPCAAISISSKKQIVETTLTGRRGTVNELVNGGKYEVRITAALVGENGNYPEEAVRQLQALWNLQEAVTIISALTDIVVDKEDRFVFGEIEYPAVGGSENVQIVKLKAHTDSALELVIE